MRVRLAVGHPVAQGIVTILYGGAFDCFNYDARFIPPYHLSK